MKELNTLIKKYNELLEMEKELKTLKKVCRDSIISLLPYQKDEGTATFGTDHFELKCQFKLKRKLDVKAYEALELPESIQFVDYKPSINLQRMRAVEMIDPSIVSSCITVEPGTPTLKITEKE